jgi:hypothetical protein
MAMEQDGWTDAEIQRLHDCWIRGWSTITIGRTLDRTPTSCGHKVIRMRKKEGAERWPSRPSPIKPKNDKPARRIGRRRGDPTLPPLTIGG